MSGVYFPGVQKPEKTEKCKFYQSVPFRGPYCAMYNICYGLEQCPAVYVPDHERLIDADETVIALECHDYSAGYVIDGVPTVIPADKEKSP